MRKRTVEHGRHLPGRKRVYLPEVPRSGPNFAAACRASPAGWNMHARALLSRSHGSRQALPRGNGKARVKSANTRASSFKSTPHCRLGRKVTCSRHEPSGSFLEGICAKAVRPFLHARGESRVAKGRLSRARIPLSGLIGLAASRSRGWLVLDQLLRHGLRTTQRAHPGLRRAR
jgi:hypothetical protein